MYACLGMNFKILLLIGFYITTSTALDCNTPNDLSFDTIGCCWHAWDDMDMADPCLSGDEFKTLECMTDCLYKRHGFLINGSIVLENGIKYLRSFGGEEFQDMFTRGYEMCYKYDWEQLNTKFGHLCKITEEECSLQACIFDSCIALHVISQCPKHIWTESEYCSSQQKLLNECIFTQRNKTHIYE